MKIADRKKIYELASDAKAGSTITCAGCGKDLTKTTYHKKFHDNKCKDAYWNVVDYNKRNNTTRISPASMAYMEEKGWGEFRDDSYHPLEWDAHKDTF